MYRVSLIQLYANEAQIKSIPFEIVAIGKHLSDDSKTLCYVKDNCGRCFIIDSDAIVKFYEE